MTVRTSDLGGGAELSAPPVLLLWALSFIVFSMPNVPDLWRQGFARLEEQKGLELFEFSAIWYPAAFNQLIPFVTVALALGIATIPQIRSYSVRYRYRLEPADDSLPALAEIKEFIWAYLPDAVILANPRRTRSLAFLYTEGWRTPGLAIFGGLIQLWRTDQQAAKSVLAHEIEHARQRDYFIAGVGTTLRVLVPLMVFLLLIASLLLSVELAFRYGWQFGLTDVDAGSLGFFSVFTHPVAFLGHYWTLSWLAGSLGILALAMTLVLVPVASLWVMELNADRVASGVLGRERLIETIRSAQISRFRNTLLQLFLHPPGSLRIWSLQRDGIWNIIVMLVLIPLAYLLSLMLLHLWAFTEWLQFELLILQLVHESMSDAIRAASASTLDSFWANSKYWFTANPARWVLLATLIIFWPIVAHLWRGLPGRSVEKLSTGEVAVSLLCGGLVAAIAGLAFLLA